MTEYQQTWKQFSCIRTKVSGNLYEDLSKFQCCRRRIFAIKRRFATLNIFIVLTVTCSSTIHRKHISEFPLQQWLREHATMLSCRYIAYLAVAVTWISSIPFKM